MENAPYFDDVAGGAPADARWLTAADGVRIRVGHWTAQGAKGTVLLFPGRTEFIEKYGRAAGELTARGYATIAVDWRGQGLSDRLADDRGLGHVRMFSDYQRDVDAMLAHADALNLPKPYFLLAHSMGGCIGLRALHKGLPVNAVGFSAPMWGMTMDPWIRPFAWLIPMTARAFGREEMLPPGQTSENYVGRTSFEDNLLTTDPEYFEHFEAQLIAHPELGIGGPSCLWLNEALIEMYRLHQMPSPKIPAITHLGTNEQIVSPQRIRDRMRRWPQSKLTILKGAKHEPIMDNTGHARILFDEVTTFFDTHL